MSKELVKLSKEVAEALETVKINPFHEKPEDIVRIHARGSQNWSSDVNVLNNLPLDIMIRALYIGYEVEETPEDKVKAHWDELLNNLKDCHPENSDRFYIDGQMRGLSKTLDLLGIKIAGVNHE